MAKHVDDEAVLRELNEQFVEAVREGSWEALEPIVADSFSYLDGATGDVWPHERYVHNLRANPFPALQVDQVVVHVDGDTAVVSARTSRGRGRYGRYVDTYARRGESWECVHACVWPLAPNHAPASGAQPTVAASAIPAFAVRRLKPERMS
jgi:ketosteroid isomerase-like protein